MTDRATLEALAVRCEQAMGPDRELDAEIWRTAQFGNYHAWECSAQGLLSRDWSDERREETLAARAQSAALQFTASLDAAMTLYLRVPERVPADPRKAAAEALRARSAGEAE